MYCDLRLDNIVLASKSDGIVMIDFEARGVGIFLSAPEITYLEYIQSLANETNEIVGKVELEHFKWLHEIATNGRSIPTSTETYRNPRHGYCVSWLCLNDEEREAAQVYMLGKVLWGIFEGVGSPEKGLLVENLREDVLEYPEWRNTPETLRELINACCSSKGRYEKFPLTRKGQLICLRGADGTGMVDQMRDAALRWWEAELQKAEEFVEQRAGDSASTERVLSHRPSLEDVLFALKSFKESMGV